MRVGARVRGARVVACALAGAAVLGACGSGPSIDVGGGASLPGRGSTDPASTEPATSAPDTSEPAPTPSTSAGTYPGTAAPGTTAPVMTTVYAAAAPIPRGTTGEDAIAQALVVPTQIPQQFAPTTAILTIDVLRGKAARFDLAPDTVIVEGMFVAPSTGDRSTDGG